MIIVYVVLFCSTEILWLQIGKQKNKTQQECAAGQMCQIDTHRENCVGNRMCVHDTHAHALNACNNKKGSIWWSVMCVHVNSLEMATKMNDVCVYLVRQECAMIITYNRGLFRFGKRWNHVFVHNDAHDYVDCLLERRKQRKRKKRAMGNKCSIVPRD